MASPAGVLLRVAIGSRERCRYWTGISRQVGVPAAHLPTVCPLVSSAVHGGDWAPSVRAVVRMQERHGQQCCFSPGFHF